MKKNVCCLLIVSLVFSSCSAFRSPTQTLTVTTDQPDSQIYVNGSMVGQGTASTSVKRNENVQLMVVKPGDITVNQSIGKGLNTTGILDIIGGCLFLLPFLGLMAAGSNSIDQSNISVRMIPG